MKLLLLLLSRSAVAPELIGDITEDYAEHLRPGAPSKQNPRNSSQRY
jgi:hypothetical protein